MIEVRTNITDPALRAENGMRFYSGSKWLEALRKDHPLDVFCEIFDASGKGDLRIKVIPPLVAYDLMRAVPGSVVNAKELYWSTPLTWSHCVILRNIFGEKLKVGPNLSKWSITEYETRIGPCMELKDAQDTLGNPEAYPWVRVGAAFLKKSMRSLLWDDTRVGKTVSMILAMKELHGEGERVLPALIVCPPNAKRVWREHLAEWWPELESVATPKAGLGQTQKALALKPQVLTIHYELLQYLSSLEPWPGQKPIKCKECDPNSNVQPTKCEVHMKELNNVLWGSIIVDEGHRATRADAIVVRALTRLSKKTKFFVFATGTPPAEDPDRWWTMNHLTAPDEWPVRGRFRTRYANVVEDEWTGFDKVEGWNPAMQAEANQIAAPRILRRTKEVVHANYKKPIFETRESEMVPKQSKAYHDLRTKMMAEVEGGIFWTSDARVKMTRLRQLASAYAELTEDGGLLLAEPSGKLDTMMELLEELEGPVVIYAEQRQLIELGLIRLEGNAVKLVGGMSQSASDKNKDAFMNGEVDYIFTNVAGGEAISLNRADTMIFLQRPWDRIANTQALGRVYEEGTTAFFYDIVTPDTVEERVFESLAEKEENFEKMVNDKALVAKWLAR